MKKALLIIICCITLTGFAQSKNQKENPQDTEIWEPTPPTVTPGKIPISS